MVTALSVVRSLTTEAVCGRRKVQQIHKKARRLSHTPGRGRYIIPETGLTVPDPIAVLICDVGRIGFTSVTWSRRALVGDGTIEIVSPGGYSDSFLVQYYGFGSS
jgi:hypothetical protein